MRPGQKERRRSQSTSESIDRASGLACTPGEPTGFVLPGGSDPAPGRCGLMWIRCGASYGPRGAPDAGLVAVAGAAPGGSGAGPADSMSRIGSGAALVDPVRRIA